MNSCAVCAKPSEKKCSLCHSVFYCSKEHQKDDWKKHKAKCCPYKIVDNEELGRHLVAVRRIAVGELVLQEPPLVSGPPQSTPPVCLGCYTVLVGGKHEECQKCGWPMCGRECGKSPNHLPECQITKQYRGEKIKIQHFGLPHPSYEVITVLRSLSLKKNRPSIWEKLIKLQSHCEERKLTEKYQRDKKTVAEFIQRFFKYTDFNEEEILKILGIININAHEVPIKGDGFISIYEIVSFLEHNCSANCSKSFSSTGDIIIRSAKTIEAGDHFTICYADPLWGLFERRQYLSETKYFSCCCDRCKDPTEFGTFYNSPRCSSRPCKGYMTPKDTLDSNSYWYCKTCGSTRPHEEINKFIRYVCTNLETTHKKDLKSCKIFIKNFKDSLHPNHYLLTNIKLAITQILEASESPLSDEDLAVQLSYCQELYKLTTTLVPAENRCRGVLQFALHMALGETGRRKSDRGEIDRSELKNNLLECKEILLESYKLLRHEPEILPEGQMALEAKAILKDMEQILLTFDSNMGDPLL